MEKTAIILGATGLTGSLVLEQLLSHANYGTIKLFSRKSTGISHPKVKEYIGDLLVLEDFKEDLTGDDLFICIGTTKKKTPNHQQYRKIDLGIPEKAVEICKNNGVSKVAVVSAIGANAKSSIAYNKIKGEMEHAVLSANIDAYLYSKAKLYCGQQERAAYWRRIGNSGF